MERKPKCTCGKCNVCKTRERMRVLRDMANNKRVKWLLGCPSGDVNFRNNLELATLKELEYVKERYEKSSFKSKDGARRINAEYNRKLRASKSWHEGLEKSREAFYKSKGAAENYAKNLKKHAEATKTRMAAIEKAKKGLPKVTKSNLGIWVNGGDRHDFDGLEHVIDSVSRSYDQQIRDLKTRIQQHHVKTIKGQDYIYSKYQGETKYHGKHDPRPELEERVTKLEDELEQKVADIRSCVVKSIGHHLVVDLDLVQKHIKGGVKDLIKLSEAVA